MNDPMSQLSDVAAINVQELAKLLGVNPRTIWRLAQRGDIPAPIRLGDRIVRWRLSDIREYLDSKTASPRAPRESSLREACR